MLFISCRLLLRRVVGERDGHNLCVLIDYVLTAIDIDNDEAARLLLPPVLCHVRLLMDNYDV